MTLSHKQFGEIHEKLQAGGFTVNAFTGEDVTSGISVSTRANQDTYAPATVSDLAEYHGDAGNQQRFGKGASFGGWHNSADKLDYLDTPTVYPDTPGGNTRARRQMLASNQIASYNIGTEYEAINPFHAANQYEVQAQDTPEQRETWEEMPRRVGRIKKGRSIPLTENQSFT